MAVEDYAIAGGGGALSGAATGFAVGGPVGAVVGGVVGGALGLLGQRSQDKQQEKQEALLRKQRRRRQNLTAKGKSIERRAASQTRERVARAAKEGSSALPPSVDATDVALVQSMSIGSGSPFDTYMAGTYGQGTTVT